MLNKRCEREREREQLEERKHTHTQKTKSSMKRKRVTKAANERVKQRIEKNKGQNDFIFQKNLERQSWMNTHTHKIEQGWQNLTNSHT